jgi:hypothetical protein
MPCPFTGHKMFCANPNILCQTKNRTVFSATPNFFVLALKLNLLNTNHLLVRDKKFGTGAICKSVFGMAQKIWTSPKCFGTRKRTRHKYDMKILKQHLGECNLEHKSYQNYQQSQQKLGTFLENTPVLYTVGL